jgi:hypothetical protein
MKVQGPGKTDKASQSKKKGAASQSDGTFSDMVAAGAQKSSGAAPTQSIARVDALLAVQEVEDPTQGAARKRMHKRADDILNELDTIRIAMLGGNLTVGHMIDVADVVASHREKITDPTLTALMDEVDLRAQVELAKMRVVLDKKTDA